MFAGGGAGGVTRRGAEIARSERMQAAAASGEKKPCVPCMSAAKATQTTQAHIKPAEDKVTLGAVSYLKAKLGPKSEHAIENVRKFICRKICRERELLQDGSFGEKLARLIDGTHRCGRPWDGSRNMYREGCGCDTDDKAQYDEASCPRGLWGPGGVFHENLRIAVIETPPKPPVST